MQTEYAFENSSSLFDAILVYFYRREEVKIENRKIHTLFQSDHQSVCPEGKSIAQHMNISQAIRCSMDSYLSTYFFLQLEEREKNNKI